jgi:hypothetical protein
MKRSGRILTWLACGLAFCAISHADSLKPNVPAPNATNTDLLRQKITQQNRLLLLKKMRARANQPSGPQFFSSSAPGTATPPANAAPANNNPDAGNPYGSIAVRNVFALNPVPPPVPAEQPNQTPPPKITLTGITTIFGPAEALYKVSGYNRNGKQIPDQSYILTEGESQDDVEVTKIDTEKDFVTFSNHGQTQVIPLANGVAAGGASGAPSGGPPGMMRRFGGNFPRPGGGPGNGGPGNIQSRFGGGYNNPNGNNGNNFTPAGQMNNSGLGSSYNNNNNNNNSPAGLPGMSTDDQAALIAAQHAAAINNPNSPIPPMLFPPTKYDNDAQAK